jgi:lipid A 3-O-deacylase
MHLPKYSRALAILSLLAIASSAIAADPNASGGTLGVYYENDMFAGTDRYYTSGAKVSWSSPDLAQYSDSPYASPFLPLFNLLPYINETSYQKNLVFGIGQNIYTPDNTETYALSGGDRPYAGWLYVGLGVVWKNDRVRNSLLLDIGVVGSYSYAQESQRYVHDARGFDHPNGWDNQLHNEVGFILAYERTWRFPHIVKRSGFDWEFMPHAGAALGNVKTHANLGAELRFGLNLPDDFGTGVIGPASSTSTPVDGSMGASRSWFPLGMYVFARMDGRAVGRNVFLDGNTFGDSHSVGHRLFVADISAGFAFNYKNTKLAYAFVYRTKEFDNQIEPQVFGAVSLNWTF